MDDKELDLLNDETQLKNHSIQALADYLKVSFKEIKQGYDDHVFDVNGESWLVLNDEEADAAAYQDIESTIDDLGLDAFSEQMQDWIINNALDTDWFEDVVREDIKSYIYDMSDEEVADECIDYGITYSEDVYDEESDPDFPELRDDVDFDDLRSQLIDEKMSEIDDYVDYYRDNFGDESLTRLIKDGQVQLDVDAIVDECLSWDGRGHFLSRYDGNEVELGDGLFGYRLD